MIAQIWRGLTRSADRHDFTSLLQARMQAELASSQACLGAYVLQRQIESSRVESLVLTLYDHGSAVGSARADHPNSAPISAKEAHFLLSGDETAARYEVIIDPQRALLYAELRRRFPLRFAGLR